MIPSTVDRPWWKEAVIYQIYPASFFDSNNDGVGDLPGIISKLDYIRSLGADTIWLSPIFMSPQKDMGYDISDYRAIHPPYGTLQDVEDLISEMHTRGMRLLMDLVVNHTSDQHAWFQESKNSRSSKKRNWYFWRDPKYDEHGNRQPPNNWSSKFGGSPWQFDDATQQYYLALFLPSQPDLNWENEDMRRATHDDVRFWLDKGVDGFRIDSMNLMSKHPDLPDAAVTDHTAEFQPAEEWAANGPRIHEYIKEIRTQVFDQYPGPIMTVGEMAFPRNPESATAYVAKSRHELNMLFTSDVANMDFSLAGKYYRGDFKPGTIRRLTDLWQTEMPKCDGWNTVYLENHDSGRSISRYASDLPEHRSDSAKMLATYLASLSGTLFLLAGQEIGMANMPHERGAGHYTDVEGRNFYNAVLETRGGDETKMDDVLRELKLKARDHGRLPVQWNASPHAGFTGESATPWKEVNPDYVDWNMAAQENDPQSVMSYWKRILALRKRFGDVFVHGGFRMCSTDITGDDVIGYQRQGLEDTSRRAFVLLNFSGKNVEVDTTTEMASESWRVLTGSKKQESETVHRGTVTFSGFEGVIFCNWQ